MAHSEWRRSLFYSATAAQASPGVHWTPRVDVYRTNDGWLLKFELAGVELADLEVYATGSVITVRGIRHDTMREEEGICQYLMEIPYNRFQRSIELPCPCEGADLNLDYRNGILRVRVTGKGGSR